MRPALGREAANVSASTNNHHNNYSMNGNIKNKMKTIGGYIWVSIKDCYKGCDTAYSTSCKKGYGVDVSEIGLH